MCEYCLWCFTGDEPDFVETYIEWYKGMKENHPNWKPNGMYKVWERWLIKCRNSNAPVEEDGNITPSQEDSEK